MKPLKSSISLLLISLLILLFSEQALAESSLISGSVFCDHNKNHALDTEEHGLRNIHIQIFAGQCSGTALQTIHTDDDGHFTFHNYEPGTYFVRADVACVCGGRLPTTEICQKVTLAPGESIELPPFGYSDPGQ